MFIKKKVNKNILKSKRSTRAFDSKMSKVYLLNQKRSQQMMSLPFGMIFSIILIIAFIVVAFIAIKHFLNIKDRTQVISFIQDFQEDVNNLWRSQGAENIPFETILPVKIKYVCFVNFSLPANGAYKDKYSELERYSATNSNMFFYPIGKVDISDRKIEHIDLSITQTKNPHCIENKNGRIKITLNKGIFEINVKVS